MIVHFTSKMELLRSCLFDQTTLLLKSLFYTLGNTTLQVFNQNLHSFSHFLFLSQLLHR